MLAPLRPWRADDVPDRLMAFGDPLVQRFSWAGVAPYSAVDARAYVAAQERGRLRGDEISFALVAPADESALFKGARRDTVMFSLPPGALR